MSGTANAATTAGLGHNNPPTALEVDFPSRTDVDHALKLACKEHLNRREELYNGYGRWEMRGADCDDEDTAEKVTTLVKQFRDNSKRLDEETKRVAAPWQNVGKMIRAWSIDMDKEDKETMKTLQGALSRWQRIKEETAKAETEARMARMREEAAAMLEKAVETGDKEAMEAADNKARMANAVGALKESVNVRTASATAHTKTRRVFSLMEDEELDWKALGPFVDADCRDKAIRKAMSAGVEIGGVCYTTETYTVVR